MNKAVRAFTMAGFGLLAGAALGMAPAQAADAKPAPQSHRYDNEVVGYYRNPYACEQAGRVGERYGAWDDYDCSRVRWGFRRGAFALIVDRDDWGHGWNGRWHQGTWPRNWSNRPQWPGHGFWFNGSIR